ncbi:MAG: NAD-glutamate dehydrogenase, partial [Gammaproteobacteria bacterium]|nr:NAD-glutamate dehydrogenase [Gammaproteobacteria bacterium]
MTKVAKPDNPFADKVLLAPLYRLIEERHNKSQVASLIPFAKKLFASSSQTELASLSVEKVYGRVLRAWEFVQHRASRSPKVAFYSNDDACEEILEQGTTILILVNNMPFLVDSVSQELTGKGIGINAIFNAVIHCERNAFRKGARESRGKLIRLSPTETSSNFAEALIIVHTSWLSEAQCAELRKSILDVLKCVAIAVSDYPAMCARVLNVRQQLLIAEMPVSDDERQESCEFIEWLVDNNFTFLGYERFNITGAGKSKEVNLDTESILGISRLKTTLRKSVSIKDEPGGAGELILRPQICDFAKSSARSKVHRPGHYDYVLIKELDSRGNVKVEHRILGLYTSSVYFQSVSEIPLVRKKVRHVLDRSGFSPNGHSIKGLFQVINVLPRDELFQINSDQLFHTAMRITQIQERRHVRLFVRKDSYGKFFSCLIFIPRDNYNTRVREQIQEFLMTELRGVELDFSTYYSESILARLHIIIHSPQIGKVKFDRHDLETRLVTLVKPWDDELSEVLQAKYPGQKAHQLLNEFGKCFPISYREEYPAAEGVADIPTLQLALATGNLSLDFSIDESGQPAFKVFRPGRQLVLSEVVPVLENFGLRVSRERNFCFNKDAQSIVWLHDYSCQLAGNRGLDEAKVKQRFEQAFEAVWCGNTENDRFNALVLISTLAWREVSLLRAYSAYMKQIQASYSQLFVAETLINHAEIAELLVEYFFARFNPVDRNRHAKEIAGIESRIIHAIEGVTNLAEDTVLRLFFKLILATRRTNYFQKDQLDNSKAYISFKFMPQDIEEIPRPRPKFEIFVYAPQMEGVHLRGGSVARGGLRWSDRKEDFRTEVLGLVKAQQVKNSVIVPVGAKGGFVVKEPTDGLTRDEFLSKGQACYRMFISGLLDLTDNIIAGGTSHPDQTVLWDDDDPYLVVAADKGTATFSDIANEVAAEYG